MKPMPGFSALSQELISANLRLGIASASPRSWVEDVLDRINVLHLFSVIVTGDDVKRGKPEPDSYLLAAERFGLPPEQCLALEDSFNGLTSAKGAGMPCIAVPNLLTEGMDFSTADLVVRSLEEVSSATIQALRDRA